VAKLQINAVLPIRLALICSLAVSCSDRVTKNEETKNISEVKIEKWGPRDVENWGPRETPAGKRFNVQPNGQSANWVKVKSVSMHPKTHVTFGGKEISGTDLAKKLFSKEAMWQVLQMVSHV
jgi:hypothetical protein